MTSQFLGSNNEPVSDSRVSRRQFVSSVGAAAAAISSVPLSSLAFAESKKNKPASETHVSTLFASLSDEQKKVICFDWDYKDRRGILRTHVSNNWHITKPTIASKFFTKDQQDKIEAIFFGLYNPDWRDRIMQQLKDDAGGYGKAQNIAIFGKPGTGKFELVMTGRHLTVRCDGNSTEHAAFGGPIFYGHAAKGFNEKADHPGNVFWPQALKSNALYKMLDGKQRKQALVKRAPRESLVHFKGKKGKFTGIPVSELTKDQLAHLGEVLKMLIEPYRGSDQKEALNCLKAQGGLEKCHLTFYESGDLGNDGVWDNWRLEGPSFVWHFRGAPHVHVWVNVASNPEFKITTRG
jgi:hypothetical protein